MFALCSRGVLWVLCHIEQEGRIIFTICRLCVICKDYHVMREILYIVIYIIMYYWLAIRYLSCDQCVTQRSTLNTIVSVASGYDVTLYKTHTRV